jgi:hypothetical protein
MAMAVRQCNTERIARCRMTRASLPPPGDYSLGIAGAVITMLQLA